MKLLSGLRRAGIQLRSALPTGERRTHKTVPGYYFADYFLDARTSQLFYRFKPVQLSPLGAKLLCTLLERPGEIVTRSEIAAALWGDRIVSTEQGINTAMRQVRRTLNDDQANPQFIKTHPRRGYEFIESVELQTAQTLTRGWSPVEFISGWRRHATIAAVCVLLGGLLIIWNQTTLRPAGSEKAAISILPITSASDPGGEAFASGLQDELVIALRESEHAPTVQAPVVLAHDMAGLRRNHLVLESKLQTEEDIVRIRVKVWREADAAVIWAKSYDCPVKQQLEIQRRLAEEVSRDVFASLDN